MTLSKYFMLLMLTFALTACEQGEISDSSIWVICDKYPDVCEDTHSGALCSIQRNDTIRAVAAQRETPSSINAYNALNTLDDYRVCLEDAYVSEAVRNKSDKQSQITTIQRIPEIQDEVMASTRRMARPEVNLWLWQKTQNDDFLESMKNGVEMAEEIHNDVYTVLMSQVARQDLDKAREFARVVLSRAKIINDIEPAIYEFYVNFYLQKGDKYKAAVWQGLYSARDADKARINREYFKFHQKMSPAQLDKAKKMVDSLLFDARWLNKSMNDFPKELM